MSGMKDGFLAGWDKFRAFVNIKYLITGLIGALIFAGMLSAAPSPWWVEETTVYRTRLFLNYAETTSGGVTSECLYSDTNCVFLLQSKPVDGHQFWGIYSAAQAFTIIAIVVAFFLSAMHFGLAFVARFLPRWLMIGVHAVNIGCAFFLCISTILPWTILMSLHSRAARDSQGLSYDTAQCTFYEHLGDIRRGGPACTYAGRQIDSASGVTYWEWEPTGGWILNCVVFWITLLTYLPANVLWVLHTNTKIARGSRKSIRRGRGMTSSRHLSKQMELDNIKPNRKTKKEVPAMDDSIDAEADQHDGGAINFGDDAAPPRERAESTYDGGAINFSGNEAPRRSESEGSDGAVTDSEEDD